MNSRANRGTALTIALSAAAALLAACGDEQPENAAPAGEKPHGYVEGAEETAEAQSRLVVADAETGAVHVLDLSTEQVYPAGRVEGVQRVTGDGRFGYLTGADQSVHVVDSGSWMVDHGDHVHYYRAPVREVGPVPGTSLLGAYSDPVVSAVSFPDGTATLLDRAKLDAGSVVETGKVVRGAHAGAAVPYGEHILASVAEPGQQYANGVRVHDRQGRPVAAIEQPCPQLQGQAVTRRGVVFGCADGALLITGKDGAFTGEKIPYPRQVDEGERATGFTHRPGSTTLAAKAGDDGVWSLDVTRRTWSHFGTGPVVAVNAVGEGAPLLTLTRDGVLHALDASTGEQRAQAPLMSPEAAGGTIAPVIQVDTTRAYVNNPASGELYEIDYNDNLRRARTFTVEGKASHMVETGR
ncbi:hypothetical protein [Amycolatopsis nigrescens]|uniref:hypothetical protein n=1 Tax=Amycolatopsis nigrescens TaxID=381445 RepID=UPI00037CED1D|nr:hypothetical protein [Amycolatopsis nigrescens]